MSGMNFIKGVGVGLVVGSAVGMAVTTTAPQKKGRKQTVAGKALKTLGDIVENIGDAVGM